MCETITRRVKSKEALLAILSSDKYKYPYGLTEIRGALHIESGINFVPDMFKYAGTDILVPFSAQEARAKKPIQCVMSLGSGGWNWLEEWLEPLEPPVVKLKLFDEE